MSAARIRFRPSVGVLLMVACAPVLAQESDVIVVTGSRIGGGDTVRSNPVVLVDAKAIEQSGLTNLADLMKQLPALTNSWDSNDSAGSNAFIGGTGINMLNLRNLGEDRTLVLVNGRRHVASLPGSAAIDTNTIPLDLIQRIDITTGGASAIYGADGVSGVVNFIMKDNFEGFRVRTQFSDPEEGGNQQTFVSALGGMNFLDNRGNVALSVEYGHDNRLSAFERKYSGRGETRFVVNPNDPDDDPNIPDRIPLTDLRWFESGRGGAVDVNAARYNEETGEPEQIDFFHVTFDGGTDQPWDPGNYPDGIEGITYAQGGSGTPTAGYSGDLLPLEKRVAANLFGHFDLTERMRVTAELKYVHSRSLSYAQPTFDFYLFMRPDNPFIPPNIRAAIPDGNSLVISRDNFDLGIRGEDITRNTYRGVLGLEGNLTSWLKYNVSAVYGETDVDNISLNNRYNDRFAAALDAVAGPGGTPVCRSNLDPGAAPPNVFWQGWASPTSFTPGANSGCVPINIFGDGSPSQAAIDWIMVNSLARDKVAQKVATAYIDGNMPWFKTPGGEVGFALGTEWRRETSASTPAIEDQLGLTAGNQIAPSHGVYEVSEAFVELNIPILSDRRFAHTLSLDAAERFSHYTTIGNASTWKVGLLWAPVRDLTFRGTLAQAVRAPNISELFSPAGQTFLFVDDPCDPSFINDGTQYRAANCAAIFSALGVDLSEYNDPFTAAKNGILQGNSALAKESADTYTVGFVLRPRTAPALVVSIDYYNIDLTNAINTLDPQDIADQCVDLPTIDNQFCALLTRADSTSNTAAGGLTDFLIQPVNVARFRTKGYDFSVGYAAEPGSWRATPADWGTVGLRLVGNYLDDLTYVNLPGADPDPDYGEKDAPKWQTTVDVTWERGPFSLNYGVNYFSATQRYTTAQRKVQPDIAERRYLNYNALFTHDLQGRYRFRGDTEFVLGVNNFTNQQPDLGEVFYPVSAVGRTWYAGVTFNGSGPRPSSKRD